MYSETQKNDIINQICDRISKGESLRKVLASEGMPSSKTFFEWIDSSQEKVKQYARATEDRADAIFEEILDIADDGTNDIEVVEYGEKVNQENIQRSRLRVDARKWMLGKMHPKKYADKMLNEHSGSDGKPIQFVINETRNYESN